jgi:hypothetical protein
MGTRASWKLPGYVIEDFLGRGGSGEVWRARIGRTGQAVALKRLPLGDPDRSAAARAEAATLSALDHPHLIRLHDVVRTDDAIVLVLDLADAGSLADLLARRTRITPGEVVTALAPIGAALAYAHAEGVVHGDVSAANVLFTSIGLPLLADLGLARIIGEDGPVRGTLAYLDPVVANGYPPGPATDVFGLAAVAVHVLRGRPLWPGDTAAEQIEAAASAARNPIDLARLLPDVAESMRAVLGRALIAEPQARCTAAEFALDLRHSLVPAPVELSAGRAPRAPALAGTSVPATFMTGPPVAQAAQFTYGARLPPVLTLPRPRRRPLRVATRTVLAPMARLTVRQRRLGAAAASVAAVIAAAVFLLIRPAGPTVPAVPADESRLAVVSVATATTTGPTPAPTSGPTPVLSTAIITDSAAAARVLDELDQLRERAFAQRDPQLFAQVYASADLRNEETATMTALVAPGCTLTGVRTTYSGVRLVPATAGGISLTATASLSPSTLACAGDRSSPVDGAAPTSLLIGLQRGPDGRYRIASLQPGG